MSCLETSPNMFNKKTGFCQLADIHFESVYIENEMSTYIYVYLVTRDVSCFAT